MINIKFNPDKHFESILETHSNIYKTKGFSDLGFKYIYKGIQEEYQNVFRNLYLDSQSIEEITAVDTKVIKHIQDAFYIIPLYPKTVTLPNIYPLGNPNPYDDITKRYPNIISTYTLESK